MRENSKIEKQSLWNLTPWPTKLFSPLYHMLFIGQTTIIFLYDRGKLFELYFQILS